MFKGGKLTLNQLSNRRIMPQVSFAKTGLYSVEVRDDGRKIASSTADLYAIKPVLTRYRFDQLPVENVGEIKSAISNTAGTKSLPMPDTGPAPSPCGKMLGICAKIDREDRGFVDRAVFSASLRYRKERRRDTLAARQEVISREKQTRPGRSEKSKFPTSNPNSL